MNNWQIVILMLAIVTAAVLVTYVDEQQIIEQETQTQSPNTFLPDRCVVSPTWNCVEFRLYEDELGLVLQNNAEVNLTLNSIQLDGACFNNQTMPLGTRYEPEERQTHRIVCNNETLQEREAYSISFELNFSLQNEAIQRTAEGSLYTRAE